MKELLLHLWKSSRAFQIAVLVSGLAIGFGFLGRNPHPPATPSDRVDAATDLAKKGADAVSGPEAARLLAAATDVAKKSVGTAGKVSDVADVVATEVRKTAPEVLDNTGEAAKAGGRGLKKGAGALERLADVVWGKIAPDADPKPSTPPKP